MNEYTGLGRALAEIYGREVETVRRLPVSGGDINRAYRLELSNGEKLFMKANSRKNISFFRAEAEGLGAIRRTGTVNVPDALAIGTDDDSSFLLLEYIEPGRPVKGSSAELGRRLALMHLADTDRFSGTGKYGFAHDNYIGAGVQINTPKDSWIIFFRECRLAPQAARAASYFSREERKRLDHLLADLDQYLTEPQKPSLLHGDLWAGNYMIDNTGEPWLIDPAAYVGHPEADLAMTELFGGFGSAFYDSYRETAGIDPGYRDRKDLYNLYHLLNHLNLFGGGYLYSVKAVIERYA